MAIESSKNQIVIAVKEKLYPLEAIYGTSYVFLDSTFIFLDQKNPDEIIITLKPREKMSKAKLAELNGEFHNELLNHSLRYEISKNNKKLREYIVSRALIGALGKDSDVEEVDEYIEEDIEEWTGDDLGIAVPWEEQTKKVKKNKSL